MVLELKTLVASLIENKDVDAIGHQGADNLFLHTMVHTRAISRATIPQCHIFPLRSNGF